MDNIKSNQDPANLDISCISTIITEIINKCNEVTNNSPDDLTHIPCANESSKNIEFTTEPEHRMKSNCAVECSFPLDTTNQLIQVDVYATTDVHNGDLLRGTSLASMEEDELKPAQLYNQNMGGESSDDYTDEDEIHISNIMSDHNYTANQFLGDINSLKKNLTNLLLKHSKRKKNIVKVSDFVKNILASINDFNSYETEDVCGFNEELSHTAMNKSLKVMYYKSEDDSEFFVQNMMNMVAEDDAVELNEEERKKNASLVADELKEGPRFVGESTDRAAVDADISATDRVSTEKSNIESESDIVIPKAQCDEETGNLGVQCNENSVRSPPLCNSETIEELLDSPKPEDSSQLLESAPQADTTSNTIKRELPLKSESTLPLLKELSMFANVLYCDCCNYGESSSTVDELQLRQYILQQIETLKEMANTDGLRCVDKCFQTDKQLSLRKLRKLNAQNKQSLLLSSSSSSSGSSCSSQSSSSSTTSSSRSTSSEGLSDDSLHSAASKLSSSKWSTVKDGNGYRNGVFRKGVSDSETTSPTFPKKFPTDSDKENRITAAVASMGGTKVAGKLKLNSDEFDADDENDKEIDRLVNLHGLGKRQPYNDSAKLSSADKSKPKAHISRSRIESLDFSDEDAQKNVVSDEVISESEEEILTEQQYLARCNENLKQQLLNDSSSEEPDASEGSETELDPAESDGGDSGSPLPLIDKFLKSFIVDESESEEAEIATEQETRNDAPILAPDPSVTFAEEKTLNDGVPAKINEKDSKALSDCELIHDNSLARKRKRPKSLEKMLADADKRKKSNKFDDDLISLSSESDVSDIEPVDTTSRLLKPMLRQDQLAGETRKAQKQEADRIRRLDKKQVLLAKVLKEHPIDVKSNELILDYVEETKTFIKVHPGIVKQLKPHQIEGVRFMYDSCYGGVEALKKNSGSGCILAHCMGLGKTLQLIALLHTVISYKELQTAKILVLCPKSTVMNWADEVVRWLGPLNTKNLKVFTFNDTSDIMEKLGVLREWSLSSFSKAGCLLVGYEAFRTLVFYHSYKNRGNVSSTRLEDIREKVDTYLLQPGADLVVCDEGHIIKNNKSAISLAVAKIITPKRIVLTGTPIQNNLKEYYSMVNFIKPLFLGTEKEFANLYANPIKNGQHKDSNKRDIKVMKQRSFVLHKKLSKFVQRKEAELLKTFLPQKFEYVLFIPMTQVQRNLYEHILDAISKREENRGRSLITDYTCLRKIWTHPKVLEDAWKNATNQKNKRDARRAQNQAPHSEDDQPDDIYDSQTGLMSVTNDWWRHLLSEKDLESIMPSTKLRTMFEILRMCEDKGEKCLIFSAFVAVLNVVEYFFKKITQSDEDTLKELTMSKSLKARSTWIVGQDYYRLDGKTPKSIRHEMIKRFNSAGNKRTRVFLISAKAGGQGINLTGANRVIILDTSWNPSNDQQNIFRIFRLGQKKNCYIYRLLAMGSMEEKVYSRSVTKQAMSFRVVDEQQIDRHYSMAELAELYTLTTPDYSERSMPVFPQDSILASLLLNYPDLVYKYHEHDSLLENKVEQELSEQEKADAWAAYERDLQLSTEIREIPSMDEKQGIFTTSGVPNYFNALAGLDMQSLLNYSSLGQQAAASPFMQSLLSQYNYATGPNQQYLDMYNMYRKMTQSSIGYPDMTAPLVDGAVYAGSPYGMHMHKSVPAGAALLSGHHRVPSASNPLTALGDLSMYGLNPQKNLTHSSSLASVNQPASQQQLESVFSSAASSCGPNLPPHSNSNAPFLGQYKQMQNTFRNLYNYPSVSPDYMTSRMNKPKLGNSALQTQFSSPTAPSYNHIGGLQSDPAKLLEQTIYPNSKKIAEQQAECRAGDGNMVGMNPPTSVPAPIPVASSAQRAITQQRPVSTVADGADVPSALESLTLSGIYESKHDSNNGLSYPNSYDSANASSLNMGIVYPSTSSARTISTSASAELLKGNTEMQIIPTTNPPGTLSASIQLNELSPSISLTAVSAVRPSDTNDRSASQAIDLQSRNPMSFRGSEISTNNAVSANKTKNSNVPSSTSMVAESNNCTQKPLSTSGSTINSKAVISLSPGNVCAKPAAPAVIAKSLAQPQQHSLTTAPSGIVPNKKLQVGPTHANDGPSMSPATHKSGEQLTRIAQQAVDVTASLKSDAAAKNQNPQVNVHFGGGAIPRHVGNIKTQNKVGMGSKSRPLHDTHGLHTSPSPSPVDAKPVIRTLSTTTNVRVSSAIPTPTPTMQLQRRPPQTQTSGGGLAPVKSTLNIRPVDSKQSGNGTGVYIIETNINERKVAIGAPTKSGGGTTVTKVPLEKKRPGADAMPKDINFIDAKRQKV